MKRIRSLAHAPDGLATYCELEKGAASWRRFKSHEAGTAYKDDLRDTLVDLQHGLCGYCEVGLVDAHVQVEHVVPQLTKRLALDPANMIACCLGGEKSADDENRYVPPVKDNRSCGQAKADRTDPRFLDPRDLPALPSLVRVRLSGEIEADSHACTAMGVPVAQVRDTIRLLGLNVRRLQQARRRRWNDLNRMFGNLDNPRLIATAARQELTPDRRGRLPAFFTAARSFFGQAAEAVVGEPPPAWI